MNQIEYGRKSRTALIKEAQPSLKFRGHRGSWILTHRGADYKCGRCKKTAQVLCKPQPNEIEIGGNALALGCND